jgi:hypothetical protein
MNTGIDRSKRSMRPSSHGWLLAAVAVSWLVGVQAAPGCCIRRTSTHVSPSSKAHLKYEKQSTLSESCLHHALTVVKTTSSHKGPSTAVHLAATGHLAKSAILAHHQVHKSLRPVHNEAREKGEKPDKDDLVRTVSTTKCVAKPPKTAAGHVTPPSVTPATSHPVPEPAGFLVATLIGGAGLIARRRVLARSTIR